MPVQSLIDLTIDDDPYILIGIHAVLEPYRLAYYINKHLNTRFARTLEDQDVNSQYYVSNFPVYRYFDESQNASMYLLPNKVWGMPKEIHSAGLFGTAGTEKVKTTLLKEHSQLDFVLKIESDESFYPLKQVLQKLKEIPRIISCYSIDPYTIKQTDYLIFE